MDRLWYGGDYNPEQWPAEVWDEDVRLMQRAGVTIATVGVFSWATLEPQDGRFEFGWLDDVLDRLHAGGIRVDLATATASPPPWLVHEHPDVLPVTEDGVVLSVGSRQHYSPSSATYRRYADRLVRAVAERYRSHPALEAWHVNNELGCHVHRDYSDESAAAFRRWLEHRYGDVATLNEAWGTAFWSQAYSSFDEIRPPRTAPTFRNPTQLLDFDRFSSDAWLEVYRAETAILREVSPGVPITTNLMGFFKPLDYWRHAALLDFVSDDHYVDPADPAAPVIAAMTRDLMRSLGGGKPWILMEQSTSAVNWRRRNAPKPPGMYRALSLQAVARGADGVMQFQWRQSRAGAEKFHSAMLPHGGEDTRIFRETVALGQELAGLSDLVGTRLTAPVAIVLDWDSWWALEQAATPAELSYQRLLLRWYRELWRRGVLVDFVRPDGDVEGYRVVIAAGTQVLPQAAQDRLAGYVRGGGTLVVGYQTAILDEHLHVLLGGYLGALRDVLGIRIEEFAPPAEPSVTGGPVPALELAGLAAGSAQEWGEVVRVAGAEVLSTFAGGMLDGLPAITRNGSGAGAAWYVATAPDDLGAVVDRVLAEAGVEPGVPETPDGVEAVRRGDRLFLLNHTDHEVEAAGTRLEPHGSAVLPTGATADDGRAD
ncbi:beta-galactosidase [Amnibacterium sp. CER49]|uniref:beta-galactosidase n=1 Tax=Amnibacterium sp. CER49 TaxID=3039161 RepID=UPI00244A61CB|nr:beta-galactosidase [Amnibacterium sp. CER49]MDH2444808.1 beta-galactosidase [Amnibacterium sp. CER49]